MSVQAVDVAGLAASLADRAVLLADPRAGLDGVRVARVAVDGAVPADTAGLADAVAEQVRARGRPVLRVCAQDFLRPRSVRLEHGPADADSGYERWVDHLALRREVLDPLGPGGRLEWLQTFWDAAADRATRAAPASAVPGSVAVVDGPFLLRWETADAFELTVHLQVSDAGLARRLDGPDLVRTRGAWERYLSETWPAERADVLVRFDRPAHPALVVPTA